MVAMIRRADGHCHEPASVVFSVLSLAMHFHGWLSIFITLYYKLPPKNDKTARRVTINTSVCTVSCAWTLGSGVQFSTLGNHIHIYFIIHSLLVIRLYGSQGCWHHKDVGLLICNSHSRILTHRIHLKNLWCAGGGCKSHGIPSSTSFCHLTHNVH